MHRPNAFKGRRGQAFQHILKGTKMAALYKYGQYLSQSNYEAFDKLHNPGTLAPHSGIYRCENCGETNACNINQPLPPQNHKQHSPLSGPIQWRLIVWA